MQADRFELVRRLVLEVTDLPESERDAYLAEACNNDPDLCEQVTSLLAREGKEPRILKTGGAAATASDDALIGSTVSHFRILGQLGVGGMGVVYEAEDTSLKRTVALKFLPPELARDPAAKARFLREAQAAASLDHTNICTVYETGESEGLTFIAMACVDGRSLKEMLEEGPLELDQVLGLSTQIAEGLKAAHDRGIVHRDVKPANVLLTSEGRAKIADFGLAKFSGRSEITTGGTRMGTVSYMSPEQARGDPVDHRTDIWSLGAMLYEMVTGRRPFRGDHDSAVIYSILNEEPEAMSSVREGLSQELQWIVDRGMAKDPDERYQTAADMLADLRALAKGLETETSVELLTATRPRPSIAVLPFVNMSGDPEDEYFSDGLAEDLINALSHMEDLRVVARTSAFSFKGKHVDTGEIGRKLRVGTLLEGSVRRSGNRLRISAQLVNAADGYHLWSDQYDREMRDVFAIQDEITLTIVDKLKVKLLGEERPRPVKRYTDSVEAYHLYLRGRFFQSRERHHQAVEYFEQAVEEDPGYPVPYAEAASSLSSLIFHGYIPPKEGFPKVVAAANRALEIDDKLPGAHTMLGVVSYLYEHSWTEAQQRFQRAIALDPDYRGARMWYSGYLHAMGRSHEAMEHVKMTQRMNDYAISPYCHIANAYTWMRLYDKAIEEFHKTIHMAPDYILARLWLGEALIAVEMYDEAITEYEHALALAADSVYALGRLGYARGLSGQKEKALEILDQLSKLSRDRYVQPTHKALVCLGLGRDERGFAFLEEAHSERDPHVVWLRHPVFDRYRSHPRFIELSRKMGLED